MFFLFCHFDAAAPVMDLRLVSAQSTTATVTWTQVVGLSYALIISYMGPCTKIDIRPQTKTVIGGIQEDCVLSDLQEFSQYMLTVLPDDGNVVATQFFTTSPAGQCCT